MPKLAIKGHPEKGNEVIERLEMLGGKNIHKIDAIRDYYIYFIMDDKNKTISLLKLNQVLPEQFIIYTLKEFLEKFPYKVGNKVNSKYFKNYKIEKMKWIDTDNKIVYKLQGNGWYNVDELEPYKEKTMEITEEFYNKHCVNCGSQRCTHNGEWLKECEHYKEETTNKAIFEGNAQSYDIMNNIIKENMKEIRIDIPKGYEFFGIDDDNKIVLTEKQLQYPKTYKECAKILNCFGAVNIDGYKGELLDKLQELLICRDAYWKIAGEEMGLDKPWESDFTNNDEERYGIYTLANKVEKDFCGVGDVNMILVFPTEEMRDAFYENFKELINDCKELL